MPPMPQKLIIDTDPGVDDLLAIALALVSPEIEVVGLTTVFGNVDIDRATANALYILEVMGRTDIPVVKGATHPWYGSFKGGTPVIHGRFGLGDNPAAEPSTIPADVEAADFIHETARANPGSVSLFAVGPLTNIADAVLRYPHLPSLVKDLVIMGGNAFTSGNTTPTAEANVLQDPEAADFVLGLDWPAVMIGLDATHPVVLSPEAIAQIGAGDDELHFVLRHAMAGYQRYHESTFPGYEGLCPHDATALLWYLDPHLFESVRASVRVETAGISRGKTWPVPPGTAGDTTPWKGRPLVEIPRAVAAEAAAESIIRRMSSLSDTG